MADNTQLPPPGDPADNYARHVQPGPGPGRAVLAAVLLVVGGALLGLIGGVIWAAVTPRVVYQVYTLSPPTAYAVNPETSAFIAADGIFTFISVGGGILLGLAGYLFGVRRHGPAPMAGLVAGGVAAAFAAKWLGTLLTGGQAFDSKLASSKPGALLRAPITVGSHGAFAFWPVAAAATAGILELLSYLRARRLALAVGPQVPGHAGYAQAPQGGYGQPPAPGWSPQQPPPRSATSAQPWPDGQGSPSPDRYGPDPTGQAADLDH